VPYNKLTMSSSLPWTRFQLVHQASARLDSVLKRIYRKTVSTTLRQTQQKFFLVHDL